MRTKYEIAAAVQNKRPGRMVEVDLVHDLMCEIADDLEIEAAAYWDQGAGLRKIADMLRGRRPPT